MGETNPQALPGSASDGNPTAANGGRFRAKKPVLFGRYELLSRFRVGGMAEVWTAKRLTGSDPLVALKRILPSFTDEADYVAMFRDEARLAQRLVHPNIVATHEVGQLDDQPFLVLEHVQGQTVAALIRKARELGQPVPIAIALRIAVDVCSALEYAHALTDERGRPLGIVHRDVSPTNVLVAYDGGVKLIDFGIAKSTEQLMRTQAGLLKGKHGYLSPEQALGESVDARSDLFSLAICVWELLAADRLFLGASDFSSIVKVREAVVPPLLERNPNVPEGLSKVLERALSRDPNARLASAAELRDALFAALTDGADGVADTEAVASYMREVFADERMLEESDTSDQPAPYEGTGLLDAFDDLDPVSAVSALAHMPESYEGERIDTLEAEEVDDLELGPPLEDGAEAGAVADDGFDLVREPEEADEVSDLHAVSDSDAANEPDTASEPDTTSEPDIASEPDTASERISAEGQASSDPDTVIEPVAPVHAQSLEQAPLSTEAEAALSAGAGAGASAEDEASEDWIDEPTRVVAYHSTASGEVEAVPTSEIETPVDTSAPIEASESVDDESKGDAEPSETAQAAAATSDNASAEPGQAATLPGLGSVEWDDEELSTHLYDGPSATALDAPGQDASAPPTDSNAPSGAGVSRPSIAPFSSRPSLPVSLQRTSVPPGAVPSVPPGSSVHPRASIAPAASQVWTSRPWILPAFIVGVALLVGGAFALFQTPAHGTIQLTTKPSDARVLFDGRPVSGNVSPFVIVDVRPSTQHTIEVSHDGFRTWSASLAVAPGQTLELPEVSLAELPNAAPSVQGAAPATEEPAPTTQAAAPAAPAQDDGHARKASPAPSTRASSGPRSSAGSSGAARPPKPIASASAPAPRPATGIAAPKPATKPAVVAASAASGDSGMLRINSRPWSQVHVDGRLVGNTPQMAVRLSPGKHTVLLVNPEFGLRKTMTVEIKRGAVVTKIVTLTP